MKRRKRVWLAVMCGLLGMLAMLTASTGPVRGQAGSLALVVRLTLDLPARALALPSADRLVVLTNRAVVYRVSATGLASPGTIRLDDAADHLASAGGYALAAGTERLTTLTPPLYNQRRGWEAIPLIDLPSPALSVVASPIWGAVLMDSGYLLLELVSADVINSQLFGGTFTAALVHEDTLLFAPVGEAALHIASVATGPVVRNIEIVPLDAPVLALAADPQAGIGAALLANEAAVLFDLRTYTILSRFTPPIPADRIAFARDQDTPVLVFARQGGDSLGLVDAADPSAPLALPSFTLPAPLTAWAVRDHALVVAGEDASLVLYALPAG